MAIGVFIAPILLYWEALSSETADKAISLSAAVPPDLGDPQVAPALAVRCLDQEGIFRHFHELIAVSCSGWDPVKLIAHVRIKERPIFHTPSAGKFRDDLLLTLNRAREGPVILEGIVTALARIDISPVSDELRAGSSFHTGARRNGEQ
jgi:hypothetical protein